MERDKLGNDKPISLFLKKMLEQMTYKNQKEQKLQPA